MKTYKHILPLIVAICLLTIPTTQAQHITQVEYWFDQEFSSSTTQSVQQTGDRVLLNIPYPLLTDRIGVTDRVIYYRFQDSQGHWSAIIKNDVVAQYDTNVIHTMQVEYWFDNHFAQRKLIPLTDILADTEGTWGGQMADLLTPTDARYIHYRFKDAYNTWSPIVSSLLASTENYRPYVAIEYWFDDDFAQRKATKLNTKKDPKDPTALYLTNNDIKWQEGKKTLYYRLVDKLGGRTEIHKYDASTQSIYRPYVAIEYWFDDDFAQRKATKLNTQKDPKDPTALYLTNNDIKWQEGKRTLYYRLVDKLGGRTEIHKYDASTQPIHQQYTTVEYWFDDDFTNLKTAKLNTKKDPKDPTVLYLTNNDIKWQEGKRTLYYRLVDKLGQRTEIHRHTTSMSPYKANHIVQAEYWFNDRFEERQPLTITTQDTLYSDQRAISISLPQDTIINLRYQDALGYWSSIVSYPVRDNDGKYSILHLTPNINELVPHDIAEGGIPFFTYRIVDGYSIPVEGLKLSATINGHTQLSSTSDKQGIVQLPVLLSGKDPKDTTDDWVAVNSSGILEFAQITDSLGIPLQETEILTNHFTPTRLSVFPLDVSQLKISTRIGLTAKAKAKIGSVHVGLGTGVSLSFYNDMRGKLQALGYSNSSDAKVGAEIHTPKGWRWGAEFGAEAKVKFEKKGKINQSENLAIGYAMFLSSYLESMVIKPFSLQLFEFGLNKLLEKVEDKLPKSVSETASTYGYKFNLGANHKLLDLPLNNSFSLLNKSKLGLNGELGVNYTISGEKKYSKAGQSIITQLTKTELSGSAGVAMNNTGSVPVPYIIQPSLFAGFPSLTVVTGVAPILWGVEMSKTVELKQQTEKLNNSIYKLEFKQSYGDKKDIKISDKAPALADMLEFDAGIILEHKREKSYSSGSTFGEALTSINPPNADIIYPQLDTNKWNFGIQMAYEGGKILTDLPNIAQQLNLPTQDMERMKEDFVYEESTIYEMGAMLKIPIVNKQIWGHGVVIALNLNGTVGSTYPMTKCYYNQQAATLLPTYAFPDVFYQKESLYFKGIENGVQKVQRSIRNSVEELWDKIVENAQRMVTSIKEKVGDLISYVFSNRKEERQYIKYLRRYNELKDKPQTQKSILSFSFTGGNETFEKGTEIDFRHYYPGGEVFGMTQTKDTMIVVSDIFIFDATYQNDTLQKAPNGKITLNCIPGADDLKFLSLDPNTKLHLYYQGRNNDYWHDLGTVTNNDTRKIDQLGVYALGTPIQADKQAPTIDITVDKNEKYIDIQITDNIGIKPNSLKVVFNGIVKETEEIGYNLYRLHLMQDDINQVGTVLYVEVMDLVGNRTTKVENIEFLTHLETVNYKNLSIYPNPASSFITVEIGDHINETVTAVITDISGKEIYKKNITHEKTTINIAQFGEGIYFFRIGNTIRKIMIK